MATLTVQSIVIAGLNPSLAAANGGGDDFPNDGRTYLEVDNQDASPITVTVDSPEQCNQGFDHDEAVVVTNGQQRKIGPFERGRYGGSVNITYSAVTSVTVGAFSLSG